MKLSVKTLRLSPAVLSVLTVLSVVIILGPLKHLVEFERAESVKGYWASLQDFVKENGRYPNSESEIGVFFRTAPDKEPAEYVAPGDDRVDEVVLWWRQKTIFGVRIGITESGTIVKQ